MVTIQTVSTSKQKKQFMRFAWDLYKGDPNWVPPLRMNLKELLNYKKHPFYEDADIRTFIAVADGKVCGRIAAIVDHGHNRYYKEKRGMFGFFECTNDQKVANALFDAAKAWFAEQDIHLMRGPMNPSMNYECSLLVEGFDSPPTFMMTYNKEYYGELIENYGFFKSQDLYAFWGSVDMIDKLDPKLHFIAEEATKRLNLTVRPLSKKSFAKDVEAFTRIYNLALPGQWGFVPLTEAELVHMADGLKHLIVHDMTTMAEVEGKPVGVTFGLLDYNPIIKQIDGRLFPFGFLKLIFGRKNLKRVRLISTNVLPEYQRWGIGLVLMTRLIPEVKKYGIEEGEFSWVLESNKLSRGTLERGGAKRTKTYRIYDYEG